MTNKFLYTKKTIAEHLDVSMPTLMRFIREENAPVVKDGGGNSYWTTSDALEEWYSDWLDRMLKKVKKSLNK